MDLAAGRGISFGVKKYRRYLCVPSPTGHVQWRGSPRVLLRHMLGSGLKLGSSTRARAIVDAQIKVHTREFRSDECLHCIVGSRDWLVYLDRV